MIARNKKMVILIEKDFEDVEVSEPVREFRNAGIQITFAGTESGKIYTGKKNLVNIRADTTPDQIHAKDYDLIFIPGGYAPDKMRLNQSMVNLVKKFHDAGKIIAAICHGPQLLISADLVRGIKMTSWPSVAIDLRNAGADYIDESVVVDGQYITSRKPEDVSYFTKAVIKELIKTGVMGRAG
jgi:protease I